MLVAVMMALNLFFISSEPNTNSNLTAEIEDFYFESNKSDIINFTSNEE